ncbi:MAG: TRAP transporter large permease subunit [Alphaproteobacteria bacterium]
MADTLIVAMFAGTCAFLMLGFPVAFTLSGSALVFAALGMMFDVFSFGDIGFIQNRIFGGAIWNEILMAVPLFVFMGVMLERSKVAEELLITMGQLFGALPGGLGLSVTVVGALLAASTGIVGATVVTMGLLALPTMLRSNYDPKLACGTICASGTLGQIIPPSIVLVILGDQISSVYSEAQRSIGNWSPEPVSVGDLFVGSLLPGLMLVSLYLLYQIFIAKIRPQDCPPIPRDPTQTDRLLQRVLRALIPPIVLIVCVLGSIFAGVATPTEAAAVGAIGALLLAGLRVRELDMPYIATTEKPVRFGRFSQLMGARLAGFLTGVLLINELAANPVAPWIGGIAGAVLFDFGVRLRLLSRGFSRLDTRNNHAIYLGAAGLVVVLAMTAIFDLRIRRDDISGADWFAIAIAVVACLFILWGILVAAWRVWATGILRLVNRGTMEISAMVFTILIGAAMFNLVFRGLGGDEMVHEILTGLPGGEFGAIIVVMLVMFVLGFFLDFIEITFVVVPIVAPVLLANDFISPVWLGVMMAVNLQTSFLTPPFGFALFYLRGVAPPEVSTMQIYKGIIPFVGIQILALCILAAFPDLANWLPRLIFNSNFEMASPIFG